MALCYRRCVAILGSSVALSLGGCQAEPTIQSAAPPPVSSEPLTPSTPPQAAPVTQPITFTLSLDTPATDLLIQPGVFIRKGDVIANPIARRNALTSQKQELEAQLSSIRNTQPVNLVTQAEEESLALAQKQLNAAQAALAEYQRNSPWTDFARESLPLAKEEVQFTRLQNAVKRAQLNYENAQARLTEKQAAISDVQVQNNLTQQNLQNALAQVNQQILALKPTQSPHTGTVTQIDMPPTPSLGQPVTAMVKLIPGDAPLPIDPGDGLTTNPPAGTPPISDGTIDDLLPPNADLPDPNQVLGLPDLSIPSATPNSTGVPNSGVE